MFKTKFNANETKALIAKSYEKSEGQKIEEVIIKPRILSNDGLVKSLEASSVFILKYIEEVDGFKKEMERYLEIDDVCGYITRYFEDLNYRNVLVSVRSKMDDAVWSKEADETSRVAHFDGLVFEYEYKETINKALNTEDENKTTRSKSTTKSAELKKTRNK